SVLLVLFVFIITSCAVNKKSMVVRNNIQVGMSIEEVTAQLGPPFNKTVSDTLLHGEQIIKKTYFYREELWTGSRQMDVENILIFHNGVLVEIKKGKESPVHPDIYVDKE